MVVNYISIMLNPTRLGDPLVRDNVSAFIVKIKACGQMKIR